MLENKIKIKKEIMSLVNRDELRRLEKAAREKDKKHLANWAKQFENRLNDMYIKAYEDDLSTAIETFSIAIVYALRFSENTKWGQKRIYSFMEDIFATVDCFRTGEYNVKDYINQLKESGINMFSKEEE